MSILGLLISLVLTALAVLLVVYPLVRPSRERNSSQDSIQQQTDRVQAYYERVLTNIRDLDEDFATGKIRETDYQEEREVWVHRGIRLLRVQDQLDAQHSLVDSASADAENIDRAIEATIRAYRDGEAPAYHDLSAGEKTGSSCYVD